MRPFLALAIAPCAFAFTVSPLGARVRNLPVASPLFETRETSFTPTGSDSADESAANDAVTLPSTVSVTRPAIHWTVPGYKVGWRDEDGVWYDEDGKRNGPPQNYWRQRSDEREYNRDMDAMASVLAEFDTLDAVRALESRNPVRRPSLSRKLLGSWAPIFLDGEKAASNDKPADDDGAIDVPCKLNIFRTNGPKFAERTYYGLFYAKLEVGEELTVQTDDGVIDTNVIVDETNEPLPLGTVESAVGKKVLSMGGITYVSDYVLIQRNVEGLLSFWIRCDDSYLGLNDEEGK